ncbi:MAG: hypothetical protein ACI8PZ_006032, partial [Myxococcota bacterium]
MLLLLSLLTLATAQTLSDGPEASAEVSAPGGGATNEAANTPSEAEPQVEGEAESETEAEATAPEAEGAEEAEEEEESGYPIRFEGQVTPETAGHWDLEVLYNEGQYAEGLELARARFDADNSDAEAAWHIVRFMYELGETEKGIDKLAWYKSMVKVADTGLDHHPEDRHLRFARGVANGRYGTTRGVIASLFLARSIENDWMMAADGSLVYAPIGGSEQLP